MVCIYAYGRLGKSWRVAKSITRSLLALAVQKSDMASHAARRVLQDFSSNYWNELPGDDRAAFMADLSLALSDPDHASVEHLAGELEGNLLVKDYTNVFDD